MFILFFLQTRVQICLAKKWSSNIKNELIVLWLFWKSILSVLIANTTTNYNNNNSLQFISKRNSEKEYGLTENLTKKKRLIIKKKML